MEEIKGFLTVVTILLLLFYFSRFSFSDFLRGDTFEYYGTCLLTKRYGWFFKIPVGYIPLFGYYPPALLSLFSIPIPCKLMIPFLSSFLPIINFFLSLYFTRKKGWFGVLLSALVFLSPTFGLSPGFGRIRSSLFAFFTLLFLITNSYLFLVLSLLSQPVAALIFSFFLFLMGRINKLRFFSLIFLFAVVYFTLIVSEKLPVRVGIVFSPYRQFLFLEIVVFLLVISMLANRNLFVVLYLSWLPFTFLPIFQLPHLHSFAFFLCILPVFPFVLEMKEDNLLFLMILAHLLFLCSSVRISLYGVSLADLEDLVSHLPSKKRVAMLVVDKEGNLIQGDGWMWVAFFLARNEIENDPMGVLSSPCLDKCLLYLEKIRKGEKAEFPECIDVITLRSELGNVGFAERLKNAEKIGNLYLIYNR